MILSLKKKSAVNFIFHVQIIQFFLNNSNFFSNYYNIKGEESDEDSDENQESTDGMSGKLKIFSFFKLIITEKIL
jgi:hypothetical protein